MSFSMELAHNLTLNEEVVKSLPENKKDVFIFEWLQFLDKVLSALNRVSNPHRLSPTYHSIHP